VHLGKVGLQHRSHPLHLGRNLALNATHRHVHDLLSWVTPCLQISDRTQYFCICSGSSAADRFYLWIDPYLVLVAAVTFSSSNWGKGRTHEPRAPLIRNTWCLKALFISKGACTELLVAAAGPD
jgi:hypothetical protein